MVEDIFTFITCRIIINKQFMEIMDKFIIYSSKVSWTIWQDYFHTLYILRPIFTRAAKSSIFPGSALCKWLTQILGILLVEMIISTNHMHKIFENTGPDLIVLSDPEAIIRGTTWYLVCVKWWPEKNRSLLNMPHECVMNISIHRPLPGGWGDSNDQISISYFNIFLWQISQ